MRKLFPDIAGISLLTDRKNRYIGAAFADLRTLAMSRMHSLSFAVVLLAASPVMADDSLVKLPVTPAPLAGPTTAAATAFCGEAPGKAEDLIGRYSSKAGLQKVYETDQYLAYADDPKNATVMYTFTTKHNPAYPAVVCRKVERRGDNLTVAMKVICDGEQNACAKLRNDFNVMNAEMQAAVDHKIAEQKK
jgi:hypothetical protein